MFEVIGKLIALPVNAVISGLRAIGGEITSWSRTNREIKVEREKSSLRMSETREASTLRMDEVKGALQLQRDHEQWQMEMAELTKDKNVLRMERTLKTWFESERERAALIISFGQDLIEIPIRYRNQVEDLIHLTRERYAQYAVASREQFEYWLDRFEKMEETKGKDFVGRKIDIILEGDLQFANIETTILVPMRNCLTEEGNRTARLVQETALARFQNLVSLDADTLRLMLENRNGNSGSNVIDLPSYGNRQIARR